MAEIKNLSDQDVIKGLKKCVRFDRENEAEMIAYIEEVERRRLYINEGYENLFAFLTEGLGLANASAQLRIDSARLMTVIPEIKTDLSEGNLNISQLSFVAKAIRQKKKESPKREIRTEEKKKIIEQIKGISDTRVIQRIVAQELDLKIQNKESHRVQQDGSVMMQISLTREEFEAIQKAKDLLSHVDPNPSWGRLYGLLAKQFNKQKDPSRPRRKSTSGPEVKNSKALAPEVTAQKNSRNIKAADYRATLDRDKCCKWKTPGKESECGSTFQLQVDHVIPLWAGGTSEHQTFKPFVRFTIARNTGGRQEFDQRLNALVV